MSHLVIEPHPSIPIHLETPFISSGRGGAGNFARYQRSSLTHGPEASGPASASKAISPPTSITPRSFSTTSANSKKPRSLVTGRGGAGNVRPIDERKVFDFEDELKREQTRGERLASVSAGGRNDNVVHIGRGGAGNAVSELGAGRQGSHASSRGSVASSRSSTSEDGWRRRISRVLTRE